MCLCLSLLLVLGWPMLFYCVAFVADSGEITPGGLRLLRAPNVRKKGFLRYLAVYCIIPFLGGVNYFFPCAATVIAPFTRRLEAWQLFAVCVGICLSGSFPVVLFGLIKNIKARRNVFRLLADCKQDGSLCAIYAAQYEESSTGALGSPEWIYYDMMQDGYSLQKLAKCATQGLSDMPVLVVMNIPPEQVLQKLSQYNLVTKNGYERLPRPEKNHLIPKSGSMVHFFYRAEYVRILG